jgi:hypothetical protein
MIWFPSHLCCWNTAYNNHQDWIFSSKEVEPPNLSNLLFEQVELPAFISIPWLLLKRISSLGQLHQGGSQWQAPLQLRSKNQWVRLIEWLTEPPVPCGKNLMQVFSSYENQGRQEGAVTFFLLNQIRGRR